MKKNIGLVVIVIVLLLAATVCLMTMTAYDTAGGYCEDVSGERCYAYPPPNYNTCVNSTIPCAPSTVTPTVEVCEGKACENPVWYRYPRAIK